MPLSTALKWKHNGDFLFEEKIDGQFSLTQFHGYKLACERISDLFYVFDVISHTTDDSIKGCTLKQRRELLDCIFDQLGMPTVFRRPATGSGGEFLEAVLANGGEGVVAKPWNSAYNEGWIKAKRLQNFTVVVSEMSGQFRSVAIMDAQTAEPRGHVVIPESKIAQVRVGSVLKVNGLELTKKGLIREPRLDSDSPESWLVKF